MQAWGDGENGGNKRKIENFLAGMILAVQMLEPPQIEVRTQSTIEISMKNLFSGFGRSELTPNAKMAPDAKEDETQARGDLQMLQAISMGDRTAFARFHDQYGRFLFSIARRILNDQKASEDVLREVFREIWDKAGSYNSDLGNPVGWAVVLVQKKAIDLIRSHEGWTAPRHPRKLGLWRII